MLNNSLHSLRNLKYGEIKLDPIALNFLIGTASGIVVMAIGEAIRVISEKMRK